MLLHSEARLAGRNAAINPPCAKRKKKPAAGNEPEAGLEVLNSWTTGSSPGRYYQRLP